MLKQKSLKKKYKKIYLVTKEIIIFTDSYKYLKKMKRKTI